MKGVQYLNGIKDNIVLSGFQWATKEGSAVLCVVSSVTEMYLSTVHVKSLKTVDGW